MKIKTLLLICILILSMMFTACGSDSKKESSDNQTPEVSESQTVEMSEDSSSETDGGKDSELNEEESEQSEKGNAETTEPVKEETSAEKTPEEKADASESEVLKKVKVYTDDVGIYSVAIELNDQAADKAVIEMVYTGATGTAQEGSIVNRYRIEYYKDSTGKYEISTYYDGNIDRNLHQQDVVKLDNTFGAATRAADVVITYTPDGGEAEEIFSGYAKDY